MRYLKVQGTIKVSEEQYEEIKQGWESEDELAYEDVVNTVLLESSWIDLDLPDFY